MAATRKWTPALAVVASLACARATSVPDEEPSAWGAGGGPGVLDCRPESGCSGCTGCIAACVCSTGDQVGCVESCGPPTGPGPPPDPPPAPGAGGAASSGGGAPNAGGGMPSGGTGGVSAGSGGSTAGGSNCVYPPGPYGTSVGQVVQPSLSWQGYVEGAAAATTISIQDYFDCDGTRGIHALLLSEAALWCGACQTEASELNGHMAGGWTQKGIDVLVLIIEDKLGNPAQLKHAESWKNTFKAQGWSVAADPGFSFQGPGSNGLPLGVVVDPRTMKIVAKNEGYDPQDPTLEQLAAKNAK